PTNMAVDEWLLRHVETPVLRVYGWEPGWGSYGYFVPDEEAAAVMPGLQRVRRWTGGGIVDHRNDWTYTLVVPRADPLAELKGGESYRLIHEALVAALREEGVDCRLSGERTVARGGECFGLAVEHDVIDADGKKLAGAGQRRTAGGLLHQGSVAGCQSPSLGPRLADLLSESCQEVTLEIPNTTIAASIGSRYGRSEWQLRR
ncbi:MAG: hypothetical protein AAGB14_09755, partial [Verrucomicrobiota bacterium]